jgi:tRNA pseudouridine synthase 10
LILEGLAVGQCVARGVGPCAIGDDMTETEKDSEKDEEWLKFANTGFGTTDYSLWDDAAEAEEKPSEDDFGYDDQLEVGDEEIPSAPRLAGLKHLLRIGTCDHCLGRLGGKKRFGQTSLESGLEVRESIIDDALSIAAAKIEMCPFCEDLFAEAGLLAELIHEASRDYEHTRLQLGTRIPKDQVEDEEHLRKRFGAAGSNALKTSLLEEIALRLREMNPTTKLVNDKPQILALIDVLTLTVELDIRSHYVYGRYNKFERGIPQTRWPCRACKGRGCESCKQTGLQYATSVQGSIGDPLIDLFEASEHSFHGMGREDIDVRCLGRGRPFVLEFKNPKRRDLDLSEVERTVNSVSKGRVEINSLRVSNRSEVVRVIDTPAEKSYTIRFKIAQLSEERYAELTQTIDIKEEAKSGKKSKRGRNRQRQKPKPQPAKEEIDYSGMKKTELVALCEEKGLAKSGTKDVLIERLSTKVMLALPDGETILNAIEVLSGCMLAQRTPQRVSHRRADLVRRKRVVETTDATIEEMDDGSLECIFSLRTESGTYVKEAVHGDSGRTQPSLASMIKADCEVVWLDVSEIHAD